MKRQGAPETSEDLVRAFTEFFEEDDSETPEEIDAALREAGYDSEEIGAKMQAAAERALAESPLNWRNRAQKELEDERVRIADSKAPTLRSRAEIIAAIKKLVAQFGDQMAYAHRNLELETDEDLASLLVELRHLASQQGRQGDE